MARQEITEKGIRWHERYKQLREKRADEKAFQIAEINKSIPVFPGLPDPAARNDPQELRERLREALAINGWNQEKIDSLVQLVDSVQAEHEAQSPKKEGKIPGKRDNGDPTTNHELEIMMLLAFLNRVSMDDLKTAATHDLAEDLPEFWKNLTERRELSTQAIGRVHAVTNVRGRRFQKQTAEVRKREDARATNAQLLGLLRHNPRALDLKLNGDIWNNSATFGDMKNPGNALIKARRVLEVFDPIHRLFGNRGIANRNADNAFSIVNPAEFDRITSLQTESLHQYSADGSPVLFSALNGIISIWENEILRYSSDPAINRNVTSVETRSVYRIWQRMGKETQARDTLPFIKITCASDAQKDQWIGFLKSKANARLEQRGKDQILSFRPAANGRQMDPVEIVITTLEEEITPDILFMTHAQLSPYDRRIAEKKLADIVKSYDKAKLDGQDVTVQLPDILNSENTGFYTDTGELRFAPNASTYLDAITMISPGLANETVLILAIDEDGNEQIMDPGAPLKPDVKLKALKIKDLNDYPDLYRQSVFSFSPVRYDLVTTRTSIRAITRELEKRKYTPEMLKATRLRARQIIAHRYSMLEEHFRNFDQFVQDGFNEELEEKYGTVSNMLELMGRIPIPLRDETSAEWEKPENYRLDEAQVDLFNDLNRLVRNLLDFRRTRPTLLISGLNNKRGVLRQLGEILDESGADILPMRARADNLSDHADGEYPVNIELVFRKLPPDARDDLIKRLENEFSCKITTENFN